MLNKTQICDILKSGSYFGQKDGLVKVRSSMNIVTTQPQSCSYNSHSTTFLSSFHFHIQNDVMYINRNKNFKAEVTFPKISMLNLTTETETCFHKTSKLYQSDRWRFRLLPAKTALFRVRPLNFVTVRVTHVVWGNLKADCLHKQSNSKQRFWSHSKLCAYLLPARTILSKFSGASAVSV